MTENKTLGERLVELLPEYVEGANWEEDNYQAGINHGIASCRAALEKVGIDEEKLGQLFKDFFGDNIGDISNGEDKPSLKRLIVNHIAELITTGEK